MTLIGNRVFADLVKLSRGHYLGPKFNMTRALIRRQECEDTETQGGRHVKTQVSTGMMVPQAKEHQRLPAITRS